MGLPCFRLYYWSCNIRALSFWCNAGEADWVEMEEQSCNHTSLRALVYSSVKTATPKLKNVVVSQSMKIWLQIRKYFKWHDSSTLAPIIHNHEVTPSFCNNSFSHWEVKGIYSIQNLYIQGIFASFDQLCEKYAIANSDFF